MADSIELDIKLSLDETAILIQYPYADKQQWSVFNAYAYFAGAKIKIFSITGEYEGSEILNLPGINSALKAEKFKYNGELNLPNINNPFASNLHTYTANVWISPEIGLVKMEGFAMFVSPLSGMRFNIADSNKIIKHTLVSVNN